MSWNQSKCRTHTSYLTTNHKLRHYLSMIGHLKINHKKIYYMKCEANFNKLSVSVMGYWALKVEEEEISL